MKTSTTGECVICAKGYTRFGNNASPVKDGRCCDRCNDKSVIPMRLALLWKGNVEKEIGEKLKPVDMDALVIYAEDIHSRSLSLMANPTKKAIPLKGGWFKDVEKKSTKNVEKKSTKSKKISK